ncbi:MAG TPA: SDR family oxidoreductase [Candidatus Limnocylindrales bacterium]|nr:SDR family oxidoreductase [Candidatus Limnocylindrales bacterium]
MSEKEIALITGSTRGIGKEIALRLARDGIIPILNYCSNKMVAERTLEEVKRLSPGTIAIQADVSKADEARYLVEETIRQFGHLDILVNNVGPYLIRSLFDTTDEEWYRMIDGNLSSAFYCTKHALRSMRARRNGHIINIGALNAEVPMAIGVFEAPAYYIAKTGLMMMTKYLARSEGKFNIRVNAINPGFIETEEYARFSEENKEKWKKLVPLGYLGAPGDIAELVSFLISEKARYITGAIIHVHGGMWV